MTAPTIRVHRDGRVTADGESLGLVHTTAGHWWVAVIRGVLIARTRTRREAVSALLDHTYGKDRWT